MFSICVKDIVKKYKNGVSALNGISLSVHEGEIFSLLGENGAGKSTLINILTTYLMPTSGKVTMFNKDIYIETGDLKDIRQNIACVSQKPSIDTYLSLTENMMFQSRIYKIAPAEAKNRMDTLIYCFGLERYLPYPISSFSGGVKRRLDIALNMMSNPKILFLDEPTVGMDVISRMAMWDMMRKIREDFGTTFFLTTHYLEEADTLSDTVCIMKNGKELLQDSPRNLRKYLQQDYLQICFDTNEELKECYTALCKTHSINKIHLREKHIVLQINQAREEFEKMTHFLLNNAFPFTGIEMVKPSLEDVFIELIADKGGTHERRNNTLA